MGNLLKQALGLINLDALTGSRSQLTIVIAGILNFGVRAGMIHLAPTDLTTVNDFLVLVFGYFFSHKITNLTVQK